MTDERDDDDRRRPGGYSVRGGSQDVEVVGRRRLVRRHTPRLRLDPETQAKIAASAPGASAGGTPTKAPPGREALPPDQRPTAPPPTDAASVPPAGDTRRLPSFGGAGVVDSSSPPPRPPTPSGPAMTRREPRASVQAQAAAGREDDTLPVPTVDPHQRDSDTGPIDFDEDESGVIRRGARPHTPMPGLLDARTPPLGVELEPPAPSAAPSRGSSKPPARRSKPSTERVTPSLGFRAPTTSRPPARRDHRTPPVGSLQRIERVTSGGIDAISSAPPAADRADEDPTRRAVRVLETLRSCGPDDEGPAVAALKKIGLPALEPMEREFPGLLWFHRRVSHKRLPRGRDVGSLARAIIAFGEPCVPMMRRFLENGDIDQRFYATLIAGDLMPRCHEGGRAQLLESLGRRLRDVDAQVSDAALHVLMAYRSDPAIRPMVGAFVVQMGDLTTTPSDRVFAARVLGVLRCGQALSAFVERLDDPSPKVRDAARKALRLLTAEDLGSSRRKWASWVRKRGSQPRVRWLIEGLVHRDEDLRTMAARELDKAGVKDFGYSPSMSRGERKRVYKEALAWFAEEYE